MIRLLEVIAAYFCMLHGLAWLILWLRLPMGMIEIEIGGWLWRGLLLLPLVLMGGL